MLSPTSEDDATCCLSASGSCLVSTGSEGVRMWDLRHTQRAPRAMALRKLAFFVSEPSRHLVRCPDR